MQSRWLAAVLAPLLALTLWGSLQRAKSSQELGKAEDLVPGIERLEAEHGTRILTSGCNAAIPAEWRDPPAEGRATPIEPREGRRVSTLILGEIEKLPAGALQNLEVIYLCGSLEFFGVGYGGTSLGKALFLTSAGRDKGFDEIYLRELFHHELSSLLMRHHRFPLDAWKEINPKGFQYADSAEDQLEAIASQRGTAGSEEIYRQGFLTAYSRSSLENDVNSFAEKIFVKPPEVRELLKSYPAIAQKFELLRNFYLEIDPGFQTAFNACRP